MRSNSPKKKVNFEEALKQGLKYYHGTPCRTCGGTERTISSGNCAICKKNWSEANRDNLNIWMKEWRKNNPEKVKSNALRKAYGISFKEYKAILHKQGGKCAFPGCKRKNAGTKDYRTGKMRMLMAK